MASIILPFNAVGAADLLKVGGKGANLGELTRAGFDVPPGFCITTDAFRQFMAKATQENDIYAALEGITPDDIEPVGQEVRTYLQRLPLPQDVADAVIAAWREMGEEHAYAVRSSATAEDLPHASFAGQHDTYLNVRGREALLDRVKACFISLFTDRAILYRIQNGFDHRQVALAVIVQRMVQSDVSGIMFTADPVSGNRNIVSIDAGFGLGEALVSGLVSADLFRVHKKTFHIVTRHIASKKVATRSLAEGGTAQVALPEAESNRPALADEQAIALAKIGVRVEAHFGRPQDIEWALADGIFYVLQSRPITSLYPLPQPQPQDDALHVYFSLSHQQGMTNAMPPLSLSTLRVVLPVGHGGGKLESQYIVSAGGRLYADISPLLRHPIGRRVIPELIKHVDPLVPDVLVTLAKRPAFLSRGERFNPLRLLPPALPYIPQVLHSLFAGNLEGVTDKALDLINAHIATVQARLDAARTVQEKLQIAVAEMRHILPVALAWAPHLAAGVIATWLLHKIMHNKSDERSLAALWRGLVGNIETEMELAAGDLADAACASQPLLEHLGKTHVDARTRLARAAELPGGEAFLQAWNRFMDLYGARGPAELDLSRPHWYEDPSSLLQMVQSAARGKTPGAHRAHYRALIAEAETAAQTVIAAASRGWLGWLRGPLVRRLIRTSRNGLPLRGHHKFLLIRLFALIKPVLLQAGKELAAKGHVDAPDDIWFLTWPEVLEAFERPEKTWRSVKERRRDLEHYHSLTPPHVITSEGEVPALQAQERETTEGTLVGTPVSAGIAEGVAKVVLDPAKETLKPGEILVAPFTDPGWTPLFVNAAGLVTEVGGLMTHGAVVAREYGIPAIVGIADATRKIESGRRIRVNGYTGRVEILNNRR